MAEVKLNWPDLPGNGRPKLADGGGPPHDGDMDPRVPRLEAAVDRIDRDITDIKVAIGKIDTRMENVATKTWIMGGVVSVVIAILVGVVGGCWWIAQQYLAPILAATGKH